VLIALVLKFFKGFRCPDYNKPKQFFTFTEMGTILQFVNFNSSVSVGFWYSLANKKLHTLKLGEEPLPIQTHFSPVTQNQNCTLFIEPESIDQEYKYTY
jgi:hypothetical protein